MRSPSSSPPGLTRRPMLKRRKQSTTAKSWKWRLCMDCRVKPGNDDAEGRSRDALASEVCGTARHESVASQVNKRGRRSADRRVVKSRATRSDVTAPTRFGRGARHAIATLPPQCASGALASRRSTAALARLLPLAQLRAALPGNLQRLALLQTPLLASSSRPGRNAGEAGSEAARERSVWLRAQAPHSLPPYRSTLAKASLRSERGA
jgi:hypothetical protein